MFAIASTACTSQRMSQVTTDAVGILRTFDNGNVIPPEMIRDAKAIAVVRETEGAVVIGASAGEGVLVRRLAAPANVAATGVGGVGSAGGAAAKGGASTAAPVGTVAPATSVSWRPGEWSPPLGIEVGTGSIGLQVGGQSREIVLIFNSTAAIDQLLATGVYAIGRIEGTAGDAQGRTPPDVPVPDVAAFVRTGGLFGGVSINGLSIKPSDRVNTAAYGAGWTARRILNGDFSPPPGSGSLWSMLDEMSR